MTPDERQAHAKRDHLLEYKRQLRLLLLNIYRVDGWAGVQRAVTEIQQEIGVDVKSRGRQGEGGWIF